MILLVEDEAITRNAFADALRNESHEVIQAADGDQALFLLCKYHVDLIITDVVMPRLNGFDLIGKIRAVCPDVPILIISAYASQYSEKILDKKAKFLKKPIDPPELIAAVQRLLPTPRSKIRSKTPRSARSPTKKRL
jgi:DNA-binding response OmpR family regulator